MSRQNSKPDISVIDPEKADLALLQSDFNICAGACTHLVQQQATDYNTRFAFWNGQSADGKKKESKNGEAVLPWVNASDVRIFEADAVVNEQVKQMRIAFRRASMQLTAIETPDQWAALKATQLMQWLLGGHIRTELSHEIQRFCQWRQQFGYAVMGVFWEQKRRLEPMEISLEMLAQQLGIDDPQAMHAFAEALNDPLREKGLISAFRDTWPQLSTADAKGVALDFRTGQKAIIPTVHIAESVPRWVALRPWADIVHRPGARDLQRCPQIYLREWLTEDELRDRAVMHAWNEEWVDLALQQKGSAASRYGDNAGYLTSAATGRHQPGGLFSTDTDSRDLVEVITAYQLGVDADTRAPMRFTTVFHPGIPKIVAVHAPAPYEHGMVPFVAGVREVVDVALSEARGVPDIVRHDQSTIKDEVDARRNAAQMTTLPPLVKPMRRALEEVSAMADITLSLAQQYMEPAHAEQVVNGITRVLFTGTREEIQGRYKMQLTFDVRDTNLEFAEKKIKAIVEVLSLDSVGVSDRAGLVQLCYSLIDPTIAQNYVQPMQQATESEMNEEDAALVSIMSGVEPPLPGEQANAPLRIQRLEQRLQSNPLLQNIVRERPDIQGMLTARMKALNFITTQRQNAIIGKQGTGTGLADVQKQAGQGQLMGSAPAPQQ